MLLLSTDAKPAVVQMLAVVINLGANCHGYSKLRPRLGAPE